MKPNFKTYGRRLAGATLVEAMAGMAILAMLLTSLVVAGGRMKRQSHRAALRQSACIIADGLLVQWWADWDRFPRSDAGVPAGEPQWRWRTYVARTTTIGGIEADVVTLEVFRQDQNTPSASIELLMPASEKSDNDTLALKD